MSAVVETVLPDGGYTLKGQTRTYYGCDLTTFESRKKETHHFEETTVGRRSTGNWGRTGEEEVGRGKKVRKGKEGRLVGRQSEGLISTNII